MTDEVLKKFGRYFLLDRIAQGGMAEIYRARMIAEEGAGRILVIKRIQAGYGANAEFLQMFKSETKVMLGFNHPSIVQLYDFGEEDQQPYISMELVDGKNLRQILNKFAESKQSMPIEMAVSIIERAAAGLHYAHSFKDKISGEPLNIIHRDVSPQNILISYDGNVKVIDFGIAKANTNEEATRAGVIKGKPSYLSPEQISGESLDGRSDIFALGIVLWELLVGRKLFSADPKKGENEFAVLKQIESCTTHVKPPSTLNHDVPKELDYVVLKALAKDRDKRYQTAEEFQRALHKVLYSTFDEFNPADNGYVIKSLFQDEIIEDRKKLQELNRKVEQLLASDIPEAPEIEHTDSSLNIRNRDDTDTTTVIQKRRREAPKDFEKAEVQSALKGKNVELNIGPEVRDVGWNRVHDKNAALKNKKPQIPRKRISTPQKRKSEKSPLYRFGMTALLTLAAAVYAPDFGIRIPFVSDFIDSVIATSSRETASSQQTPVVDESSLVEDVGSVESGTIVLKLNEKTFVRNVTYKVDGKVIPSQSLQMRVPLDRSLKLTAESANTHPFEREFVITSSQAQNKKVWPMDVELEHIHYGFLTIYSTPSADAYIFPLDQDSGQKIKWVVQTPLENLKFPVGKYEIKLVNSILDMEKVVTIQMRDQRSVKVKEQLELK
tara:strand:+ start:8893 stop:10887 length:1995 start_codon:yes stop_codon:yes gene_type:complete